MLSVARFIATLLTILLGACSATYFGATSSKDCYLIAQTIPALISNLLTGGVYSALMIVLLQIGRQDGIAGQAAFSLKVARQITLLLAPFLLFAALAPRILVDLIAPGFSEDRVDLSARLLPLTAVTALVGVYLIIVRCLYQTHSNFILPSFIYLIIPIASLLILVGLVRRTGIFALALGPLIGNLLVVAILMALVRSRLKDPPGFVPAPGSAADLASRQRRFWSALLPMTFAANFGQINLLVDNAFGSFLPVGAITVLGFAFVIVANTELLTTLSLAEIAFPRLAIAAQQEDRDLMVVLRWSLRYMLMITTPLAAGALALGVPLVRLLFERGEFHPDSTLAVARLLACYAPEIFFMGYLVLFSRVLFARRRFTLVTITSSVAILSNAIVDYLLMKPFGINGIALGTTLVTILHAVLLAPLVRREVGAGSIHGEPRFLMKVLASSATMAVFVFAWAGGCERLLDTSRQVNRLVEVLTALGVGGASYFGMLHLLRIDEARAMMKRVVTSTNLLGSW